MPTPVDALTVSGMTWSDAMESASRVLAKADEYSNRRTLQYEYISSHCALAQAWIALAREITMHARAQ
jgi:hypothetical protein